MENNHLSIILQNWHGGTFNYLASYLNIYLLMKEKPEQYMSDLLEYKKSFIWQIFEKSNALDMSLISFVCDSINWPDEIHPDTELIIEGNISEKLLDKLGYLNYNNELDASILSVVFLISYLSRFEIPMPTRFLRDILKFSEEVQLETVIDTLVGRHYLTYVKKLGSIFTPSYKFYHSTAAENYFQAILSMRVEENWLCEKLNIENDHSPLNSCVPKVEGELIKYLHSNPDWHEILYHFLQENTKLHYGNENWDLSLYYLHEMLRLELPLNNRYFELKGATLQKMGKFDDALELYTQALDINRESKNFYGQAIDLNHLGLIYRGLGEPEKALMSYQEALLIYQETENRYGEASVLSNIGSVEKNMGKFKDAIAHLQESFSIFNELGKKKGISKNVRTIATILNTMGDTDNALNYAKHVALPLDESSNDKYSMALDFDLLGKIYRRRREFYESIASLKEALNLKEEIGNENGQATTLGELGRVYRQMKKLDDVLEMCDQAFKIHSKYKNKHGKAYIQGTMGTIYKFKGDLDKALNHYLAALEFHKEIKNNHGMAIEYRNVATIYDKKKRLNEAEQYYELALEADRDSQEITRDTQAVTLGKLGIISRQKQNFEKSHKYHSEALTLNEDLHNIEGIARDLGNLGLNYWKWGKIKDALDHLNKAIQIDEENQFNRHLAEMYGNLGQIYMGITPAERSNLEGAISNFQKSIQLKRRLGNMKPGSVTMDLINLGRAYSHKLINKNELADRKLSGML